MRITIDDMRGALKGQRKADESIFWFCHFWNGGKQSDLYQIMLATGFFPDQNRQKQIANDPEITYCLAVLRTLYERAYGPLVEYIALPVRIDDVEEGDILMAQNKFICIKQGWPCRVFKHHGILGVSCAEDHNGKQFHPLDPDERGIVKGFVR